jgi:hypothetical protein
VVAQALNAGISRPDDVMKSAAIALPTTLLAALGPFAARQGQTLSHLADVMAKAGQIRDRYRYCRRDCAASALVAGRDFFETCDIDKD